MIKLSVKAINITEPTIPYPWEPLPGVAPKPEPLPGLVISDPILY